MACVAKINGIIKRDDMRMGFIGKPIHGDYDNWIGKTLERNDSKNPIAYFDERAHPSPPAKSLKTLKSLIANLRILAQRHVKRLILTHIVRLSYVAPDELGLVCTVDGFGLI